MSICRQTIGCGGYYCRISEKYDAHFASSRHCGNFGQRQCAACRRAAYEITLAVQNVQEQIARELREWPAIEV